jgi:peptidoglycan/LPS O-acetylase OafA/YrhL
MKRDWAFIDLTRCIAAFWVMAAHIMIWGGWYGLPLPDAVIAVDLFMMISGFLMCLVAEAHDTNEGGEAGRWRAFLLRRYFRIAPAYYASLIIAFVAGGAFLAGYQAHQAMTPSWWPAGGANDPARIVYDWRNFALHVSFLFGLFPQHAFSTFLPDWSLSLEMQFYAAFPLLWLGVRRFGYLITGAAAGGIALILTAMVFGKWGYTAPSLLFLKLQYFVAGMFIFRILSPAAGKAERLALLAAALALVGFERHASHLWMVSCAVLLAMTGIGRLEASNLAPRVIKLVCANPVVRFLADASYGVYLFHGFFISAAGLIISNSPAVTVLTPPIRVAVMAAFVGPMAVLSGWLSFRLIEKPGQKLGRLFGSQRPTFTPSVAQEAQG